MSRLRNNLGILRDRDYHSFMKTIDSMLGFDSSNKAKLKLRCIELLEAHGWEAVRLAFPQVSHASVYRWKQQFDKSDRRLTALIPHTTKPKRVRQMQVPVEILSFIKLLRTQYPKLSKYKLKPFLDDYCKDHGLPAYSTSWIGKVIKRYNYFFNHGRQVVKRRTNKQKEKTRIKRCPKANTLILGHLQLDAIIIYYQGVRLCYLTAVELKTRQAWTKRVTTISSLTTTQFLMEIINSVNYHIHTIQTDNGSEFEAIFRHTLKKLAILQLNSYPRSPQTQAYVERFNWTFQDECLYYHLDKILEDPKLLEQAVTDWLTWYNTKRPHQALNYQTPQQVLNYQLVKLKGKSLKCV